MTAGIGGSGGAGSGSTKDVEIRFKELNSDFDFDIAGMTNVRSISVALRPNTGSFNLVTAEGIQAITQNFLDNRKLGEVFVMSWAVDGEGESLTGPFQIPNAEGNASGMVTWTRVK